MPGKQSHANKRSVLRGEGASADHEHIYRFHGFPRVHQAPEEEVEGQEEEEEEEEGEVQRPNIDSLRYRLLSRPACPISLYPIRGHDGV